MILDYWVQNESLRTTFSNRTRNSTLMKDMLIAWLTQTVTSTLITNEREFIEGAGYSNRAAPDFPISPDNPNFFVDVRGNPRTDYVSVDPMITGDWDNGIAMQMDGPYINRGDDGNRVSGNRNPYFDEKAFCR